MPTRLRQAEQRFGALGTTQASVAGRLLMMVIGTRYTRPPPRLGSVGVDRVAAPEGVALRGSHVTPRYSSPPTTRTLILWSRATCAAVTPAAISTSGGNRTPTSFRTPGFGPGVSPRSTTDAWYAQRESNPHASRHQGLNLACLPFHHERLGGYQPRPTYRPSSQISIHHRPTRGKERRGSILLLPA